METIKIKFTGSDKVVTLPKIEFEHGDFVWINGDSGAGKSTLFLLMKGIIPKYIHAYIEGDVPLVEDAAYLFQNPSSQIVSPFMLEELAFSMENMQLDPSVMKQRIDAAGQMLGIKFYLASDTSCLSGGERQLLVLASMLAAEPRVILLDEPTAFLDPNAKERFYTVLHKLKGKHTVFLIDHNYKPELGLHNKTYEICASTRKNKFLPTPIKDTVTASRLSSRTLDEQRLRRVESLMSRDPVNQNDQSRSDLDKKLMMDFVSLDPGSQAILYRATHGRIANVRDDKREAVTVVKCTDVSNRKNNSVEPKISVHNLVFQHPKQTKLIEGFSMRVEGGEIVAVLGRNGAGKTTLLQLIAGILKPQAGKVTVQGKLSLVFQNPETHFYFDTVKDELPPGSDEWARHFGLDDAMNRSPFSLSEGEKRRLTLLMAVLENRQIILYDEPTFGQDRDNIEKICQVMLKLKQQGRAQVIVTHDHELASRICDHIYHLN